MILMIPFGVMNRTAMVLLAVVIAIEKQWRYGERFARAAGVTPLGLAVAVIFIRELAPGLDGGMMSGMDEMGM